MTKTKNQKPTLLGVLSPLLGVLSPRSPQEDVRRGLRAAMHEHEALLCRRTDLGAAYRGGLTAEKQSYDRAMVSLREAHIVNRSRLRAAYLGRMGRRIDVLSMMTQRHKDGTPTWAIVDPRYEINRSNGYHDTDGSINWGGWLQYIKEGVPGRINRAFMPGGLPALPARVRSLVKSPSIQRRAKRIGILYQPDTWTEVKPDPALVVEWADRPGEFYALAVWGGDMPQIMEWVD